MTGRATPDYDFFGGGQRPAAPSTPQFGTTAPTNQFGSAAPTNQFGSAAPAFGAGSPQPAPQLLRTSSGVRVPRWLWRVGISLAIALVLGVFGVGRFAGLFDSDLEAPETLDGLSRVDDEQTVQLLDAMRGMLNFAGVEDGDVTAALYSDGVAPGAFLFAFREQIPADTAGAELSQYGDVVDVGADTLCANATAQNATICIRSSDDLTVMVMRSGATDPFQVAPVVNAAWTAF